jgi:hypothetical protein
LKIGHVRDRPATGETSWPTYRLEPDDTLRLVGIDHNRP